MIIIALLFLIEKPVEPKPSIKPRENKTLEEFNESKLLALLLIRAYQFTLSGQQGDICNFQPSCSRYGYAAINKYGAFWGILMASDRLQRCNPFALKYVGKYYKLDFVPGRGYKILEKPEDVWKHK
jgi:putative membrane protein insertion efficiency factor